MTDNILKWKDELTQGHTYYMRNFKVGDNDAQYKMTPHKFRLTFVGATRVNAVEIPGIPKTHFYFKDFEEISNGKFCSDMLVDAIGVVNSIGKNVISTATREANIAFTIKDLRNKELDCTLWDTLSEQFLSGYNQQSNNNPVVIILRHVRVREAQGQYPLQLTNVWNRTKILFDPSIPEIEKFRASDIKIDELEAEYGKFLDEIAKTYDNYDGQGSSLNHDNISHTENNINQCTDNVFGQVFGGYTVTGQLTESYVFELTLCDLNNATKTQFTLPSEFSDYVRRYNFHKLVLHVPNKDISIVHLKYPNNPS
ncbi:unnamed protein product [Trifolium pratense]|uniref:Uncharacterized protein n=1 Tax=Trifolium pratense TaxID=57577 RepID=A0ACB0L2X0_TRIPR|nr:unnamed protein product [Trifolium pratense]